MTLDDRLCATARTLPFTPERVYQAFADARQLAAWWGPEGFTNEFEHFDFTVGGRWHLVMVAPNGTRYPNESVFAALEPGRRVVVRHDSPPHFTLTVDLVPVPEGTQVRWHQLFDDAATAQAMRAIAEPANEQNLDRLTRVLQASPS